MPRRPIPLELEAILVLLWIAIFVGLPILGWWMGPVEPPIP